MYLVVMVGKFAKQAVREWCPSTTGPLLPTITDSLLAPARMAHHVFRRVPCTVDRVSNALVQAAHGVGSVRFWPSTVAWARGYSFALSCRKGVPQRSARTHHSTVAPAVGSGAPSCALPPFALARPAVGDAARPQPPCSRPTVHLCAGCRGAGSCRRWPLLMTPWHTPAHRHNICKWRVRGSPHATTATGALWRGACGSARAGAGSGARPRGSV